MANSPMTSSSFDSIAFSMSATRRVPPRLQALRSETRSSIRRSVVRGREKGTRPHRLASDATKGTGNNNAIGSKIVPRPTATIASIAMNEPIQSLPLTRIPSAPVDEGIRRAVS